MKNAILPLLALVSLAACKDKPAESTTANSAAPSASAPPSAAPVTCDAVVAHVETLGKMDADGKKLFHAMCDAEPPAVRQCMASAKSMTDLDKCDPHPLKNAGKPAGPTLKVEDLVEMDLSSADKAWKGWVAKGPKDGKVMADGVHGARIAQNGVDAFDVAFGPKKTKLAEVKKGVAAGQKIAGGSVKTTYTTDTADKLEWTTEAGTSKSYHFTWNVKVSGKDFTCATLPMGAATEELAGVIKASCLSLHKK